MCISSFNFQQNKDNLTCIAQPQIHVINWLLICKIVHKNIYSNDDKQGINRIDTIKAQIIILWLIIEKRNSDLGKEKHAEKHIDSLWIKMKNFDVSYKKRRVVRLNCSCIQKIKSCIFHRIGTWMLFKLALEPTLVDFCLASFHFVLVLSS